MKTQAENRLLFTVKRVWSLLKTIWNIVQWLGFFLAIGLGVVYAVPQLRTFFGLTPDGAVGAIAAMVAVVFILVKEFGAKSEKIIAELEELKIARDKDIMEGGAEAIFSFIDPELLEHKKINKTIEIDVLGFTLFSIHARLHSWLRTGILRSMVLNLYCLDEAFIRECPSLPDRWAVQVSQYTEQIEEFISTHRADLQTNKVVIHIRRFRHIPAIHGFRIGHGTLCISFATWHESTRTIDNPIQSVYERVRAVDSSEHASLLRRLFDNWVEAAHSGSAATGSTQAGKQQPTLADEGA